MSLSSAGQIAPHAPANVGVSGEFVTLGEERYYAIRNADQMAPFFISVVSDSDHWLFVSSNGGLTAGRVSPETALFPYNTVDQIYDSALNTGCKTIVRVRRGNELLVWEPFNREHDHRFDVRRNLYKNTLGDKLLFEEVNADLDLVFRYTWSTCEAYGFVRRAELTNAGSAECSVDFLDGLQNILPAGTPRATQAAGSNLVDAYKWNELDDASGLALYTLFSGITDRAEPCESLRATSVFSTGLKGAQTLLASTQVAAFAQGNAIETEIHNRGVRGAYLLNASLNLGAGSAQSWQIVADVERTQAQVVALRQQLADREALQDAIDESVAAGSDGLARTLGASDGFQSTAEENVSVHHYANVLFNVMRGGIFDDNYKIDRLDFERHLQRFNAPLAANCRSVVQSWPEVFDVGELRQLADKAGHPQLKRLSQEFLPLRFGRRHGDPSRPWNQFAIRLSDERGKRLLAYQGNWRDIFQNWEALLYSYPDFIDNVIAKFVNASTVDGYNPYRITSDGIDWEVEEPDDPWSYIGYWGDHQIIYLLKLLELSSQFFPKRLGAQLRERVYTYANVPYRIKPFSALVVNAKSTVDFDIELAERIEQRVEAIGADGKLVQDGDGEVYQVNLMEKLTVPLLCKLSNLVLDGGIWLNTQRPEWNDANNALVGQGLSMVTLYYLRRYVRWMQAMLRDETDSFELSSEVSAWLTDTAAALSTVRDELSAGPVQAQRRFALLKQLGEAASRYRETLYKNERFSGRELVPVADVRDLLGAALAAIDHSIANGADADGLFHAYNVLELGNGQAAVDPLYPMLEGQVAALSSGAVAPEDTVKMLTTLFDSSLFRADQKSFLLYPDRDLPSFLQKNRVPADAVATIELLRVMASDGDGRLMQRDALGIWRFAPELKNADALGDRLDHLIADYGDVVATSRSALLSLYEQVFNHKAFTGRSGGMFGFEGLGSIYWHMVSKLLLAVQENYFAACDGGAADNVCRALADFYYRLREGIGFNKTPLEYGAFPTDPYSHTPKHAGAQQPGMTGQVKEELLTRFAELGVRVSAGVVHFSPSLLRRQEFVTAAATLRYLDVDDRWREIQVPTGALAYTWCQVPITYRLDDGADAGVEVLGADGSRIRYDRLSLPADVSAQIFARDGQVRALEVSITGENILD